MTQGFGQPPPWAQQPAPAQAPQGASPPWGQQPAPAQAPQGAPPPWAQSPQMAPAAPPAQPYGAPLPQAPAPPPWAQQPAPAQAPPPWAQQPAPAQAPQGAPSFHAAPSPVPISSFAPPPALMPGGFAPPGGYGAPPPGYAPPGYSPIPDPLSGIGEAEVFTKTPFFPVGNFLIDTTEMKLVISKNPKTLGHVIIILECTIVESDVVGVARGNSYAQTINLSTYGKGDLQALITALHGGRPGDPQWVGHLNSQGAYSSQAIQHYVGPTNPMRGKRLSLCTIAKQSSKTPGKVFTVHNWMPVLTQ